MNHQLPLEKMSIDEKLETMEALWENISQTAGNIQSPQWHGDLLEQRETQVREGNESFTEWETAKQEIKNKL